MARYVMSNRRSGKFKETEKEQSRAALESVAGMMSAGAQVLADTQPSDPQARRSMIFEADPEEVVSITRNMSSDVIIEPEILHYHESVTPLEFLREDISWMSAPVAAGSTKLNVQVTGDTQPLEGTEVIVFLRGPGNTQRRLTELTNSKGGAKFSFSSIFSAAALVAVPAGDFWREVVRAPSGKVSVDCSALPKSGPVGWWHEVLGANRNSTTRGNSIKVGVIDSGVGPHPCLSHVTDIGAFIDGMHDATGGADSGSHGSHVVGSIGARPQKKGQFAGVSPGVDLFSARVFPAGAGANQLDIADAIDTLSRTHEVDLINMSLGARIGSEIERDAIIDALERGTLCICAAGNSAGAVSFPAAFNETVAISALGLAGSGPYDRFPESPDKFGDNNLYLASFSCFGPEILATAPGVGVISTVPERFGLMAPYAAMDGTSMASPLACGTLSAMLSSSAEYRQLPRDETRAAFARQILRNGCRDINLVAEFQGRGVPQVPSSGSPAMT